MNPLLKKLKALSDQNRLRIVAALLEHEELCACQIVELLQVTGATASRHLSLLVNAGLIKSRKDGRWVHYRPNIKESSSQAIFKWLRCELESSPEISKDINILRRILEHTPEEICRLQRGESCCPEDKNH